MKDTTGFQQDGTTCHTLHEKIPFLKDFFGVRLISEEMWPPRSHDLSFPDFLLLGILRRCGNKRNRNIPELKKPT
jgi:hypothetical protein